MKSMKTNEWWVKFLDQNLDGQLSYKLPRNEPVLNPLPPTAVPEEPVIK